TGGVEHRLAAGSGGAPVDCRRRPLRPRDKGAAKVFRQLSVAVDIGDFFQHRPGQRVVAGATPNRPRRHVFRQLAIAVGLAELTPGETHPALFELDRAVAQDHMREIDIELVRRHVRAFRHEAHVAERAGIGDLLILSGRHRIELTGLGIVDQIEETRKGVTQVEAAAPAVTDVEDAAHLRFGLAPIDEIRILPLQHMPGGRFQAAFTHRNPSAGVCLPASLESSKGAEARAAAPRQFTSSAADQAKVSSARWKRPACDFSAFARVSNQSAISSKPSSRAVRAMPGYMSVYSCVSPAIAARRLSGVAPIGLPVAGSPTSSRYSRWP